LATKRQPLAIIAAFEADARTRYASERAFIAIGEALGDLGGKVDRKRSAATLSADRRFQPLFTGCQSQGVSLSTWLCG